MLTHVTRKRKRKLIAPGTVTVKLAQTRDEHGRFKQIKKIALADWVEDKIYPSVKF